MAEIQPRDILVQVGRGALARGNVLALGGARGRVEELKETFTRATVRRFRDRDGIGRKAAANIVALEYPPGLVDQFGNPLGALQLQEARTQVVTDPENFGAWAAATCTRNANEADPFGGTAAYQFVSTGGGAHVFAVVGFTGNGTKSVAVFVRISDSGFCLISLDDDTAILSRHRVLVNVNTGAVVTQQGGGTLFTSGAWVNAWWRIQFGVNAVVAANVNVLRLFPQDVGSGLSTRFFGANAWNSPYPSAYQGPGESPGGADVLYVPVNFGKIVCSIDVDLIERTIYTAASDDRIAILASDTFTAPYFGIQSAGAVGYRAIFDNGAGLVSSGAVSQGAVGDRVRLVARLYGDGSVELERRIGNGAAATSSRSAASALTAGPWAAQRFYVNGGNGIGIGALLDAHTIVGARVIRDTHSLSECEAAL